MGCICSARKPSYSMSSTKVPASYQPKHLFTSNACQAIKSKKRIEDNDLTYRRQWLDIEPNLKRPSIKHIFLFRHNKREPWNAYALFTMLCKLHKYCDSSSPLLQRTGFFLNKKRNFPINQSHYMRHTHVPIIHFTHIVYMYIHLASTGNWKVILHLSHKLLEVGNPALNLQGYLE